jgi:hypothetical protein
MQMEMHMLADAAGSAYAACQSSPNGTDITARVP